MASKVVQASCLKDVDDRFKGVTLKGAKTSDGRSTMLAHK